MGVVTGGARYDHRRELMVWSRSWCTRLVKRNGIGPAGPGGLWRARERDLMKTVPHEQFVSWNGS